MIEIVCWIRRQGRAAAGLQRITGPRNYTLLPAGEGRSARQLRCVLFRCPFSSTRTYKYAYLYMYTQRGGIKQQGRLNNGQYRRILGTRNARGTFWAVGGQAANRAGLGNSQLNRLPWNRCCRIAAALDYDRTGPPRLGAKTLPPLRQVVLSPLPEGARWGGYFRHS